VRLPFTRVRSVPIVPGRPPAWQRRWRRHRRLIAAVLAGVVAWSLAAAAHPPAPAQRAVLVAMRPLAAGDVVHEGDVGLEPRDAESLPSDALTTIEDAEARTVVSPVLAGEAVRARDVLSPSLLATEPPDTVAVSVRLASDVDGSVLRPGDSIDLIAAWTTGAGAVEDSSRAETVATAVRVLAVGTESASAPGLGAVASPAGGGTPLVLAVTSSEALDVAKAAVGARLAFALRSR
jgi:Flp pilus assembly protein CpaB